MAKGSPVYLKIQAIVQEVIAEMNQTTMSKDPLFGTVSGLNNDGTATIQTDDGTVYQSVGTATAMTVGTQVVVMIADGTMVAVPRGSQLPF